VTHATGAYLRIDEPAGHVLVHAFHGGGPVLGVFGPFPTLEAAQVAEQHLRAVGISDGEMTPTPIREVELNERPPATPDVLLQVCGFRWVDAAIHTHECGRRLPHEAAVAGTEGGDKVVNYHECVTCERTTLLDQAPALANRVHNQGTVES
jgi:hypothetical protein